MHPQAARRVRVLIVDDEAIFRTALSALFEADGRIEVVGAAEDGTRALELARTVDADVAVVDVAMPGIDGIETTRRLRELAPQLRVVVVSGASGDGVCDAAVAAGASAFLVKGSLTDEIAAAILDGAPYNRTL